MAELWSIAITAAATLAGAFGGAALSNKHTETIQTQRIEAERKQWARDKKLAAYEQFWNAQWVAYNACHRLKRDDQDRVDTMLRLIAEARPTVLRMLAPAAVADLAEQVHGRLGWLGGMLYPDSSHEPYVSKRTDEFATAMKELEKLMRSDVAGSEGNVT